MNLHHNKNFVEHFFQVFKYFYWHTDHIQTNPKKKININLRERRLTVLGGSDMGVYRANKVVN